MLFDDPLEVSKIKRDTISVSFKSPVIEIEEDGNLEYLKVDKKIKIKKQIPASDKSIAEAVSSAGSATNWLVLAMLIL